MVAEIGQSLLQLIQAVTAFNYQLVLALFTGLAETWRAIVTISVAIVRAFTELVLYLWGIGLELAKLGQTLLDLSHALGSVLMGVIVILLSGLKVAGACIGECISVILQHVYSSLVFLVRYTGLSAFDFRHTVRVGLSGAALYLAGVRDSLMQCCSLYSAKAFKYFAQSLLSVRSAFINIAIGVKENLKCVFHVSVKRAQHLCDYLAQVPQDVFMGILALLCLIYIFRLLKRHLSRYGMTFPSFSYSCNRGIEFQVDYEDYEMVYSSDEDFEGEEEEEEEYEYEEDSENDDQVEYEYVDEEERSEFSSDSYEDEVVEYEVITDSEEEDEDEENNPNRINVHLPEPRALRSRRTPSQEKSHLSPSQLEKILERERDRRACVVCQDAMKCVLVLPCRHMCLCVDCAHEIVSGRTVRRKTCPLCRVPIETIMNVYL